MGDRMAEGKRCDRPGDWRRLFEREENPLMENIYSSSGVYVFQRSILAHLPVKGDVEKTTFPRLAKKRKLKAYIHKGSFTTVNSLRELEEADREMQGVARKRRR